MPIYHQFPTFRINSTGGHRIRKLKLENTALSWRRQSMRKTCPIDMPEQNIHCIDFIDYSHTDDNYNVPHESSVLQCNSLLSTDESHASQSQRRPIEHDDIEINDLDSLNNEILTTILTTQLYQDTTDASSMRATHSSDRNSMSLGDSDCGVATMVDEMRPRQLGRRSETRSRVVSITAERSSEGNQVNVITTLIPIRLDCIRLKTREIETIDNRREITIAF